MQFRTSSWRGCARLMCFRSELAFSASFGSRLAKKLNSYTTLLRILLIQDLSCLHGQPIRVGSLSLTTWPCMHAAAALCHDRVQLDTVTLSNKRPLPTPVLCNRGKGLPHPTSLLSAAQRAANFVPPKPQGGNVLLKAVADSCMQLEGWQAFSALVRIPQCLHDYHPVCEYISAWLAEDDDKTVISKMGKCMEKFVSQMLP